MQCFYCGTQMTNSGKKGARSPRQVSIDHLTPTSRGGPLRAKGNQVKCCQGCNADKGCLTVDEYRVVLMFRRGMLPTWANDPNTLPFHGEKKRTEELT